MSACEPQSRRSTRPGLGVVSSSSTRARRRAARSRRSKRVRGVASGHAAWAACKASACPASVLRPVSACAGCAGRGCPQSARCAARMMVSMAQSSSCTLCARLRAHSKAGRSHNRQVRLGRPRSVRLTLSPSGRSTSMSKRRPNGDPSSMATRARFTSRASARTASRPSWPVWEWVTSRCRTGQPCSASVFSISRPSCSNAQAKAGEVLCGPGMFRPWLTRVQACRVSSSCWRVTRASRATSISSSVTGASSRG